MTPDPLEEAACTPEPLNSNGFNPAAQLWYGLTVEHVRAAMEEFLELLGFLNQQLHPRGIARLESLLMPANFSSIVGEMIAASVPKFCPSLIRNPYHNGYPDLIPAGHYPLAGILRGEIGIEIKASRYGSGWQGHNAEAGVLMVIVFDSNRPADEAKGIQPRPFRFVRVLLGQLSLEDWAFSGRSTTSRRTITVSVTKSGRERLMANWLYDAAHRPSPS